jgi:hypothetical protein
MDRRRAETGPLGGLCHRNSGITNRQQQRIKLLVQLEPTRVRLPDPHGQIGESAGIHAGEIDRSVRQRLRRPTTNSVARPAKGVSNLDANE